MITSRRGFLRWVGASSTVGMAMHWPMAFASRATTLEPSMRVDGFIRLNRNENAYGPSPKVQDVIRSSSGANRYALRESRSLLEKIASTM
jgi:histidinol-phosphate/aromatic aminotransferase/cobyric acid decarboxylase-like protein